MPKVIVDTSALYALVDRSDPNHARAARFLHTQVTQGDLVLSNHVFDETMTLTKVRLGGHVALQLGLRLRNSRTVEHLIFSAADEAATWRLFGQYADKDWSYTDCACLLLSQQREIQRAFTFDHHFVQMGLLALPNDLDEVPWLG